MLQRKEDPKTELSSGPGPATPPAKPKLLVQVCRELCTNAALVALGGDLHALTFVTCSNQWLIGTQQVAWLYVTAAPDQPSAFVPIVLADVFGMQPGGIVVSNVVTEAGRVVIVGEEPLLEALRSTNDLVQVILYALPGTTNLLQTTDDLSSPGAWVQWQRVTPTNLFEALPPLQATNRTLLIRALR